MKTTPFVTPQGVTLELYNRTRARWSASKNRDHARLNGKQTHSRTAARNMNPLYGSGPT